MAEYVMEICGLKRHLPLVRITDDLAFASFVIISDTELVTAAGKELAEKIGEADVIVTAEAKGIALTYEVSRCLGKKEFIVARKSVKSYMKDYIGVELSSITTEGVQKLYLDGKDIEAVRGRNICLVDDVVSTGESLRALETLIEKAGGTVTCRAAVLAEGLAAKREDLVFLERLPLFHKQKDGTWLPY